MLSLSRCSWAPSAWPPLQDLVLMHDKGGNPDYRPFFDQLGAMAKSAIGVGFTQSPYPDTNTFQATVRAALPTNKAPDLFTWWSTYRMKDLIDAGLVADMTPSGTSTRPSIPRACGTRSPSTARCTAWPTSWSTGASGTTRTSLPGKPEGPHHLGGVPEGLRHAEEANGITPMEQTVNGRWPTFIMFEEMVARQDPAAVRGPLRRAR